MEDDSDTLRETGHMEGTGAATMSVRTNVKHTWNIMEGQDKVNITKSKTMVNQPALHSCHDKTTITTCITQQTTLTFTAMHTIIANAS